MTLSTSAITDRAPMPATRRRMLRAFIIGAILAVVCVIFTFIYEQFSHGAVSTFMRSMFLMPLVGLAVPALVCFLTPLHRFVGRLPFNLWNSGLATWTVGCLFRGIVNISGRFTELDRIYWVGGWAFLLAAVIAELIYVILYTHRTKRGSLYV